MADNIPSLRQLVESDLRLTDPAGEFGPERQGVPAMLLNGVLYIMGRNGGEIVVPGGAAGAAMMEQARKQIEEMLEQRAMMVGA